MKQTKNNKQQTIICNIMTIIAEMIHIIIGYIIQYNHILFHYKRLSVTNNNITHTTNNNATQQRKTYQFICNKRCILYTINSNYY